MSVRLPAAGVPVAAVSATPSAGMSEGVGAAPVSLEDLLQPTSTAVVSIEAIHM
jgi:hypothetical protein